MRRSLLVLGILAGVAAAAPAQAQNYPWCAQYSGNMGGAMNCGFTSFDQCMATVRGMGGFCVENNTYQPPAGPRASGSSPRRRHDH
ncbi:MAG TPA: DUF3551 domain-containing protein [Xanthobacteraceae bacterium]|jgi:Protein of unknown function (DUF3551)|nr:DUF3551 domain-containing protein [Xanthobacteraceae bacterium]